jgi:hypothetical protein
VADNEPIFNFMYRRPVNALDEGAMSQAYIQDVIEPATPNRLERATPPPTLAWWTCGA